MTANCMITGAIRGTSITMTASTRAIATPYT